MKRFVIALTLLASSYSLFGASAATAAPAPIKVPVTFETPEEAATWLVKLFEHNSAEVDPTSAADRASVETLLENHKHSFNLKCHLFKGKINIKKLMAIFFHPEFESASEEQKNAAIVSCFNYRSGSIAGGLSTMGQLMQGLLTPLPTTMEDGEDDSEKETSTNSSPLETGNNDDDRDDF